MTPEIMQKTERTNASARALNLAISTKHSVEISKSLRYRTVAYAKELLEQVIALKRPVEFRSFDQDLGHKPGMAGGRYPQKAASEFLRLIKSAEANAQVKGMDASNLKIIKLIANKASIPLTGGRHRYATKRTHLEVVVAEKGAKKDGKESSPTKEKSVKQEKVMASTMAASHLKKISPKEKVSEVKA